MARHVLTLEERIRGLHSALKSPRTPARLRRPLQQQLTILEQRLKHERNGKKQKKGSRSKRVGLLDWLGV
jgi:hypothetical protein